MRRPTDWTPAVMKKERSAANAVLRPNALKQLTEDQLLVLSILITEELEQRGSVYRNGLGAWTRGIRNKLGRPRPA